MHEMSLAVALMDQIMTIAKDNNMVKIKSVTIDTGALKQVVPEVMQNAFEAVTKDTIAEGAEFVQNLIPSVAKCKQCAQEFEPDIDNYLCPGCDKADIEIISGDAIILKSVSGEEL